MIHETPFLPDDRHYLVVDNQGLVKWQVNLMIEQGLRQNTVNTDKEELYAVGFIGIVKAAINYDAARGAIFSTFAVLNIKHEVLAHVKKESLKRRGNYLTKFDVAELEYDGTQQPPACTDAGPEVVAMARETLRRLPGRERTAAWMRAQGYELPDIALELGVSDERVRQILVSAARRIKGERPPAAATCGAFREGNRSGCWSGG